VIIFRPNWGSRRKYGLTGNSFWIDTLSVSILPCARGKVAGVDLTTHQGAEGLTDEAIAAD
jgi:hypothetical protein